MKKKIQDENMPVGKLTRIPDFLPPPEELVVPDNPTVKVTINLNRSDVDFFKKEADRLGSKYQRIIRVVLMKYAQAHRKTGFRV